MIEQKFSTGGKFLGADSKFYLLNLIFLIFLENYPTFPFIFGQFSTQHPLKMWLPWQQRIFHISISKASPIYFRKRHKVSRKNLLSFSSYSAKNTEGGDPPVLIGLKFKQSPGMNTKESTRQVASSDPCIKLRSTLISVYGSSKATISSET